ncbi:MAG TPA: hypothetical protein VGI70_21680, partial [Polyangiales bacterium]
MSRFGLVGSTACALLWLGSACAGGRSTLNPTEEAGSSSTENDAGTKVACGTSRMPCDPKNLGGATCQTVGAGMGTLLC